METMTSNTGANLEGASIAKSLKEFTSDPDKGFRLSRNAAKKDKQGNYNGLTTSLGVIVPTAPILDISEANKLQPLHNVLIDALASVQDRLIRSILESGETTIYHSKIGLAQIAEFARSEAEISTRLSEESINAWFDSECSQAVSAYFCVDRCAVETVEELTDEQKKAHSQMQANYKGLYARCAEKNPSFTDPVKAKLITMLGNCEESVIQSKLLSKLQSLKAPVVDEQAL